MITQITTYFTGAFQGIFECNTRDYVIGMLRMYDT